MSFLANSLISHFQPSLRHSAVWWGVSLQLHYARRRMKTQWRKLMQPDCENDNLSWEQQCHCWGRQRGQIRQQRPLRYPPHLSDIVRGRRVNVNVTRWPTDAISVSFSTQNCDFDIQNILSEKNWRKKTSVNTKTPQSPLWCIPAES